MGELLSVPSKKINFKKKRICLTKRRPPVFIVSDNMLAGVKAGSKGQT